MICFCSNLTCHKPLFHSKIAEEITCPHCGSNDVSNPGQRSHFSLPGSARKEDPASGSREVQMKFVGFSFGWIRIDDTKYEHDVMIDRGEIRKRKKAPSKRFRDEFGHTPLSVEEDIPWRCRRLVIGTGAYGRLPVMEDFKREAQRRRVELLVLPTEEAIEKLRKNQEGTNAILHVTC